MVHCLNPRFSGGHENPQGSVSCQHCEFLIQGASVGSYEIVSFIGAGSYGYVYKVREPNPLNRTLALKVLRHDQLTEKAKSSFFREAQRIASMQHPNILPVYHFGQLKESEQPYFVMEYAPQTITDLFRNADGKRRLAYAEELIPYVQQTADALQYVHRAGLVHQDVKPGNLLIGRGGQILLADFGTTFYLGMQTHASLGEITGTAAYMPPEQWQGNPRRDSDQYALAICCYELLCGRTPFMQKRLEEIWSAHLKEVPPAPHSFNPRIPVEVSAVLLRALAKDYRQRYASISDFAEAYKQAVMVAAQRYLCQHCGQQNRTGAQRCTNCGTDHDQRTCFHCGRTARFGQRCCTHCGRLVLESAATNINERSPLIGVSVHQGQYVIKRILNQSETEITHVVSAVAYDTRKGDQQVVLKRWECTDSPQAQKARDIVYYDQATLPLTHLKHPLIPRVLERFAEGRYYYVVLSYIDGESLEERLRKLLRPLPEHEVLTYMNTLLNLLSALELQQPVVRHYDISPANILIDRQRGRAMLTGFQIKPSPTSVTRSVGKGQRTTRKLLISPYLPLQEKSYDQRTCIYALAASMHHALTNIAPPHYPAYPPVRLFNPTISPALEAILSRALREDSSGRYQNYGELQRDIQRLLAVVR